MKQNHVGSDFDDFLKQNGLLAECEAGALKVDWAEARLLATRPEYGILNELENLVGEVADELGKDSPYHS